MYVCIYIYTYTILLHCRFFPPDPEYMKKRGIYNEDEPSYVPIQFQKARRFEQAEKTQDSEA
jgi:hypothetical protein